MEADPEIVSGEKSIESRWYQTKRAPWDKAHAGDRVFFKNAGEPVTAEAIIAEVMQFEIASFDDAKRIVKKYGRELCLVHADPAKWRKLPKYCVLLRLSSPRVIAAPFHIDKSGFGNGAAWLMVGKIGHIKKN